MEVKFATAREAFKLSYRKARTYQRRLPESSAYSLANDAIDDIIETGYDYRMFLEIVNGVLWAIHWRFKEPCNVPPKWASERHMGFSLSATKSEIFWTNPKLP